jgi:hypothetical protein
MPTVVHIRPTPYQTCTEKPIDKCRCRCWFSAESPRQVGQADRRPGMEQIQRSELQ